MGLGMHWSRQETEVSLPHLTEHYGYGAIWSVRAGVVTRVKQFWRWRCVGWECNSAESKMLEPKQIDQWFPALPVACRHLQAVWRWNSEWKAMRKWAGLCSKISSVSGGEPHEKHRGPVVHGCPAEPVPEGQSCSGFAEPPLRKTEPEVLPALLLGCKPHHLPVLQDRFSEHRMSLLLQHNIWLELAPFPPRHPICLQSGSCLQRASLTHPKYVIN